MTIFSFSALWDGLSLHSWNDAQLSELESALAKTDVLAEYRSDVEGQCMVSISQFDEIKADRTAWDLELKELREATGTNSSRADFFRNFWPNGWIDARKAQIVTVFFNAAHIVDLKTRRVYPRSIDQSVAAQSEQNLEDRDVSLWHLIFEKARTGNAEWARSFAQMQVWVDEARIATALERYRLPHGVYPDSLDALVPAYIDELPHDIMDGEPYRYRLRPDGTFLLYSVGWNQRDDGGKVVFMKDNAKRVDSTQGDWSWPTDNKL